MSLRLDHAIVPARDRRCAARELAAVLDVPHSESRFGPFTAVYVSDELTLDFDEADGAYPVLHFCFRVDEAAFDALLARLAATATPFRSTPHGPDDSLVDTAHGGRIVYWRTSDGHVWEALTESYARRAQER